MLQLRWGRTETFIATLAGLGVGTVAGEMSGMGTWAKGESNCLGRSGTRDGVVWNAGLPAPESIDQTSLVWKKFRIAGSRNIDLLGTLYR